MNSNEPPVERFKCEVIGATEKAIQVRYLGVDAWLPRSQIESMKSQGSSAEIVIPFWLFKANFGS